MTDQIEKQEEIEKADETVTTQDKKEKVLTQTEVNALLAKEKRDWSKKVEKIQSDFDTLQAKILETEHAEETKNKAIVEGLKKDLPKPVLTLLDKLSVSEQLEFLQNSENVVSVEKKSIPSTPRESGDGTKQPKSIGQIF